jgi:hypothetical protein
MPNGSLLPLISPLVTLLLRSPDVGARTAVVHAALKIDTVHLKPASPGTRADEV